MLTFRGIIKLQPQKSLWLGQLSKLCNFFVVCVFGYAHTQNRAQTSICETSKREKGIKLKQTFHVLVGMIFFTAVDNKHIKWIDMGYVNWNLGFGIACSHILIVID